LESGLLALILLDTGFNQRQGQGRALGPPPAQPDQNVPDHTVVQALIDGQAYGEGRTQTHEGASVYHLDVLGDDTDTARTQTHEGASVYHLDVLGDDTDTAAHDGGREGDTPTPVPPTPTPTPGAVHVANIEMSVERRFFNLFSRGRTKITIVDQNGLPMVGVTAEGSWSGLVSGTGSANTGAVDGIAVLRSSWTWGHGTFIFTVQDVIVATVGAVLVT
jgi:hypothetical protein